MMFKQLFVVMVTFGFMTVFWIGYNLYMDYPLNERKDYSNLKWMHNFYDDSSALPNNTGNNNLTNNNLTNNNLTNNNLTNNNLTTILYQDGIAKRFEERKEDIKKACDRFSGKFIYLHKIQNSLVHVKNQKILYCSIQKVASTFWQKIIFSIDHPDKKNDAFEVEPEVAYANTKRLRIKQDNVSDFLKDSVSFLFVRDPFTRLLSGYLSKYFSLKDNFWETGKSIVNEERSKVTNKTLNCGHDVSFNEFVRYYVTRILSGQKINEHFSPSINHCNVCRLNFTYIGKYETIEEDVKFIIDKFPVQDKFDVKKNFEKRSVVGLIKQDVNAMFREKELWMRCLSFQCGLYRIWKRFICRGFISKHIPFPYRKKDEADKVTKEEFLTAVFEAYERSDPKETSNNRKEALLEAYMSLSTRTLNEFLQAFENDFDLLGYSKNLDKFDVNDSIISSTKRLHEFSYLEQCPY